MLILPMVLGWLVWACIEGCVALLIVTAWPPAVRRRLVTE